MPNIKSAIKRVKTSENRHAQNISQKSELKTAIKKVEKAVAMKGDQAKTAAQSALVEATSLLDKAAQKGKIHKNKAARKKSRLTKKAANL